ncbi:MAG TPA: aspartate dehydrogenase [Nitrososphaeraceae archaeon]|nr:aspartate dehydrogenase [Nitrososphaeraceae archaeon]
MVKVSRGVGIIGCGTIGTELALAIDTGRVKNASVVALFDGVNQVALSLQYRLRNNNPRTFTDFEEFISSSSFRDTDIIVESASQDAIRRFSKKIVENGKSLIVMSVGALSDPPFLSELLDIASHNSARIYVPTGAIAGIDAVRSVKHLLDSVSLTTTKNPKALADAPFFNISGIDLYAITKKTLIYEGPAADAVKKFPTNVNVAAILSLAGIGLEKTNVKIIVDPYTNINQHEIIASGKFGEMILSVRNLPSPTNPKTSFLAILSAIECLRSVCDDGIRIGT